jgi:muramoyltetrapeptide carboxypeptidase
MARTVKPPRLKPGDTIAMIAPAGKPKPDDLKLGADRIKKLGYNVYVHPQCHLRRGYLAGDDKARAAALMEVFADSRFKAIFAARGGFGCQRLIKYLDLDIIEANPKIFVGYSDLTVLLHAFNSQGLITFHGPMPAIDFADKHPQFGLTNLFNILTGKGYPIQLKNPPKAGPFKIYHQGKASGILSGGNLSLLNKLAGTPFMPSFRNKLVFLEDTGEEPYRLDGYLAHLFMASDIAKASSFIFAPFYDCKITKRTFPSLTVAQVFDDYFRGLKVPIITNVACGHGNENLTLPIGIKAAIDTTKKQFTLLESAVK